MMSLRPGSEWQVIVPASGTSATYGDGTQYYYPTYTTNTTTARLILNDVEIETAPPPEPPSAVARLLADVEAVCALGRAA